MASSALRRVFLRSMETVMGPTPPGTGVRKAAFSRTESKSTSLGSIGVVAGTIQCPKCFSVTIQKNAPDPIKDHFIRLQSRASTDHRSIEVGKFAGWKRRNVDRKSRQESRINDPNKSVDLICIFVRRFGNGRGRRADFVDCDDIVDDPTILTLYH
jgi:hypothetical protein